VVVEGIEEASDQGQDRIELSAIQGDLAEVHQKFLENDLEYARIFSQLTQQELALLSGSSEQENLEQINTALKTLDHSIQQFHQHQAATLRVQEQYLNNQAELLKTALNGHPGEISPVGFPDTVHDELAASPIESAASQAVLQKSQQVRAEREPAHSLAEGAPASGQTMHPDLHFEMRSDEYGRVNPWNFLN